MNRVSKWVVIGLLVVVVLLMAVSAVTQAARDVRANQPHPDYIGSVTGRSITD